MSTTKLGVFSCGVCPVNHPTFPDLAQNGRLGSLRRPGGYGGNAASGGAAGACGARGARRARAAGDGGEDAAADLGGVGRAAAFAVG